MGPVRPVQRVRAGRRRRLLQAAVHARQLFLQLREGTSTDPGVRRAGHVKGRPEQPYPEFRPLGGWNLYLGPIHRAAVDLLGPVWKSKFRGTF